MFRPIEGADEGADKSADDLPAISLQLVALDGAEHLIPAQPGDTVALALLKAGVLPMRRTALSGQARAPLCLMGVCFDCLVQIDGRANLQACIVEVSGGMRVHLQHGARALLPETSSPSSGSSSSPSSTPQR